MYGIIQRQDAAEGGGLQSNKLPVDVMDFALNIDLIIILMLLNRGVCIAKCL